ncbi:Peroxiredoxin [Natronorubrum daqingense]|uniref:Alkyl hydroperoxide reductase n=1 Tax=Natronorubrum daqingense TaxID=588898 RepID=A0A1N7ESF8_9EURY|nr:alkyl hydroperoxide reductase [Natronorubrum daqingense]SIR91006.1 Peroxiredoxin [Natronorubrum daqingense]
MASKTDTETDETVDAASMTLYRLHGCPYCELVVRRLERYAISYRSRFVAGEHSKRDAVARVSGTRSVPVLVDHDRDVTMPESARILEYLDRTYGEEGGDESAVPAGTELVEFPPTEHPTEGEQAPDFTRPLVTDEYWEDASLSDLVAEDGRVLVVFFPLNWGGKSVYWWDELQGRDWAPDVSVVGVGISQPFDHQRFIERRGLEYPLFSDPGNDVAERYGVVHDLDGMAGISEPRPAMFLVGPDRTVEYAWVASEWPPSPPFDDLEDEERLAEE